MASISANQIEPTSEEIKRLESKYHKQLRIQYGQRTFGPIPDSADDLYNRPKKGTQIFVGHLPRNIFETTLMPFFSTVGKIYELRLMMEFSGFTRGYCFVTYETEYACLAAIESFHGYKIEDQNICVYRSVDNSRLHLSGIPKSFTEKDLLKILRTNFIGITAVFLKTGRNGRSKGVAFIDFDSHKNAMEARKKVWPNKMEISGKQIKVEWAKPEKPKEIRDMCKIIVQDLPPDMRRDEFIDWIISKIRLETISHSYKKIGYCHGVIEFSNFQYATKAFKILKEISLKGRPVSVEWLINHENEDDNQQGQICSNKEIDKVKDAFYSVPPTLLPQRNFKDNGLNSSFITGYNMTKDDLRNADTWTLISRMIDLTRYIKTKPPKQSVINEDDEKLLFEDIYEEIFSDN